MKEMEKVVASVEAAIAAIKNGEMVIMVDDEDRENEGDLVFAADCVNSEHINFMAKEARGLICLIEPKLVNKLKLPMMEDTTKKRSNTKYCLHCKYRSSSGCHNWHLSGRPEHTPSKLL